VLKQKSYLSLSLTLRLTSGSRSSGKRASPLLQQHKLRWLWEQMPSTSESVKTTPLVVGVCVQHRRRMGMTRSSCTRGSVGGLAVTAMEGEGQRRHSRMCLKGQEQAQELVVMRKMGKESFRGDGGVSLTRCRVR